MMMMMMMMTTMMMMINHLHHDNDDDYSYICSLPWNLARRNKNKLTKKRLESRVPQLTSSCPLKPDLPLLWANIGTARHASTLPQIYLRFMMMIVMVVMMLMLMMMFSHSHS